MNTICILSIFFKLDKGRIPIEPTTTEYVKGKFFK